MRKTYGKREQWEADSTDEIFDKSVNILVEIGASLIANIIMYVIGYYTPDKCLFSVMLIIFGLSLVISSIKIALKWHIKEM